MTWSRVVSSAMAISLVGLFAGGISVVQAQSPTPKAGPDFSGGWVLKDPVTTLPDLLPDAAKIWLENKAKLATRKPEPEPSLAELSSMTAEQSAVLCFPMGFPRVMTSSTQPLYIVQSPVGFAVDFASGGPPRFIWVGLPHDETYWPTYLGESIGQWQGDTLVVDTTKFVKDTYMGPQGLPHSDTMHVVERIKLTEGGKTLEDQMRIEDPKVLREPWVLTVHFQRKDDYRPTQHKCQMG